MTCEYLTQAINVALDGKTCDRQSIARFVGLSPEDINGVRLYKKSIDARRKNDVHFVCSYVFTSSKLPKENCKRYIKPIDYLSDVPSCNQNRNVIVVGAGPAGLFAARYLSAAGLKVTLIERGSDAALRAAKVDRFFCGGALDTECNVQFGLGGAGTFSDGKLTTGISSPLLYTVFSELLRNGAPEEIMFSALPHIGTDRLIKIVSKMSEEIKRDGGEFLFDTKVCGLITEKGAVKGVRIYDGKIEKPLYSDAVVLAVGHSARDIFEMLNEAGVNTVFKPFAVGVRVEHERSFIDCAQHGILASTHRDLSSASYKLAESINGRNCYSFCMCPGGSVVPAASEPGGTVINGMSNSDRDGTLSNSALVINVAEKDVAAYRGESLRGVNFQREIEKRCFEEVGFDYKAPCQNVKDFIAGKRSTALCMDSTYARGTALLDIGKLFPDFVSSTLKAALPLFGKKIAGFDKSGILTAPETRTSSPVKILRGNDFQTNLTNLYPAGEGSGYSGGIVSSAVDGLKIAMSICGADSSANEKC